jgi:hypothetical protein
MPNFTIFIRKQGLVLTFTYSQLQGHKMIPLQIQGGEGGRGGSTQEMQKMTFTRFKLKGVHN